MLGIISSILGRPKTRLGKNLRTVFLALAATVAFAWAAIYSFNVPANDLLHYFIVSISGLAVLIIFALLFSALLVLVKRLFK